jgi:hypothetical protein
LLLHGQIIKNIFVIIDYAKGALRGGTLFNSPNWSPDSVKTESFGFGIEHCLQENWSTTLGAILGFRALSILMLWDIASQKKILT